jgi:hypothetical protein
MGTVEFPHVYANATAGKFLRLGTMFLLEKNRQPKAVDAQESMAKRLGNQNQGLTTPGLT